QGVRNGGPTGRSYGIIDTLHLAEVARAAAHLRTSMAPADYAAVQSWFRDYLAWMKSSAKGRKERDATNNHALAWALQAAEFARLADDSLTRDELRSRFQTVQLPGQMAPDGSFPRETARTKPFGYSIFQFDIACALGWSLSTPGSGGDLLRFALPDGRSLCKAAAFLTPFLADKSRWPFPHDVQHWDAWPVRSPGLLFCGLACHHQDYIALWRRLDPDPTDPEVIRNFPLRQPLLWVA
ncbi:MAG TPA: alginate lyase family protein, partial [Acidobacteriaceae bacterium]|nr:alginate lyase family protein [Acidobacteriaceae bacterium]